MNLAATELKPSEFQKISDLVYRTCGISLKQGKEALVRARLMKRLRSLGIQRVDEYLDYLENDPHGREMGCLIDVMTTNKTSFFRESDHFAFLRETVLPALSGPRLRVWSAACSSGEEPYTLAMVLREHLEGVDRRDVRILATDISRRMLEKAGRGVYPREAADEVTLPAYRKYFTPLGRSGEVRVTAEVRSLVQFAYLNLLEPWPMKGRFHVIFCRNVMIYFDRPTQQELINRFYGVLDEGGYLFVGHSEGLSAITHRFHYVRPAVYRK